MSHTDYKQLDFNTAVYFRHWVLVLNDTIKLLEFEWKRIPEKDGAETVWTMIDFVLGFILLM